MNSKEENCVPHSQGSDKESKQSIINGKIVCNKKIITKLTRSTIPANYVN